MPRLDSERSVVVVIDMQGRLMELVHEPDRLRAGTQRLVRIADLFEVPVVVTEQYPQGLGATEESIASVVDSCAVATTTVVKDSFSCCGEPGFERAVSALLPEVPVERRQYVIAGIEAHICVVQTVLDLLASGAEVFVCWECVTGRGEEYRHWALERMQQAGAQVVNAESAAFEWAGDKNHTRFKDLNRLLRDGQIT